MRGLKRRRQLPRNISRRLSALKRSLMSAADPSGICEQRFDSARDTKWFREVRRKLMEMAGASRTCMFCDHNEPTDVEHFKPKTEFPADTFNWKNMLWICTTCNRLKGAHFPPHNCEGMPMIDPVADNVWDFFLLDEFGNLIKRWDVGTNAYDARAQSTCNYAKIDREEVQTRRQKRIKSLRLAVSQAVEELNQMRVSISDINNRVDDWLAEPYQADVTDYFLRGPGAATPPFSQLIALGIVVPPP